LELTQRNALTDANQNTTEDKDSDFVLWSKCLDEGSNDRNETTNSHGPSSTKTIGLLKY